VHLQAAVDAPLADWVVRLEDVAANGSATAITGAALNGAQRHSMAVPEALTPGQEYSLDFDLHLAAWMWQPGHRIRVSVSNALWPMLWPTPYPMTSALRLGGEYASALTLPTVPLHGNAPTAFEPAKPVERPSDITEPGGDYAWPGTFKYERDEGQQKSTVTWHGSTAVNFPWGSFKHSETLVYQVADADPATSTVEGEGESVEILKDRVLTYRGHLTLSSDAKTFHYHYTRELLSDGKLLRTKSWQEDIPRDFQ
jgi:hypothetical protein